MIGTRADGGFDSLRAAALVEHYQDTAELVSRAWERRNRQFIILVCVLAAAGLVAFARQLIAPALEAAILGQLPALDEAAKGRLRAFLPLGSDLLLGLLVVTVFYLMASLCHRTGMIINHYQYLSMMEDEIRQQLKIDKSSIAFTREGPFYAATGSKLTRLIGFCYRAVLGLLLVFFFATRLFFDFPSDWVPLRVPGREDAVEWYGWLIGNFLFVVDILIAVPTLWLFARYARLRPLADEAVRAAVLRAQVGA
jgi:tetrahydromethanopterin S-methyltransferase subunit G